MPLLLLFFFFISFNLNCNQVTYYSQFGQDQFLDQQVFKGKKRGIFVDIGAYDGITSSNSYFFEKYRNWSGLCIEPTPDAYEKLKKNRRAKTINGCIWKKTGPALFLKVMYPNGIAHELSGLVESYDTRSFKTLKEYWMREHQYIVEEIMVPCFSFNDLCSQEGYTTIDYLSIDTEGSELAILQSIDFNTFSIKIIGVENNYNEPAIKEFLATKNYRFITRIGVDDFYCKESVAVNRMDARKRGKRKVIHKKSI